MQDVIRSEITILGAGPAGLTAALQLGRKGIPCLLIDSGHSPREKICGDGVSGKAISLLNHIDPAYIIDLRKKPFVTPSGAIRFYSPNLKMVEIAFNGGNPSIPAGFICKRKDFDHFLLEKVLQYTCVKYFPDTLIDKVSPEDHAFLIGDSKDRLIIRTRMLLNATGADRRIIRSIYPGYPDTEKEGIGVRAYFDNVKGSSVHFPIELHFLKELLPWYLWIFPFQDGSANVGLALPMPLAKKNQFSLKDLLFKLIHQYPTLRWRFEESDLNVRVEAHRLPYFTGRQQISGDHFLLLGDSAHLIDPFSGEGISQAMISGYIAAETVQFCIEKGDFSRSATKSYQEMVYEKLGPELELGLKLQELARKKRLLNLVIGRASKNENVRKLLEEMLCSLNTRGKLSQPLFYLKLMLGI